MATELLTKEFYERSQRTGEWWFCPAGHRQRYTETTERRLEKQVARLQSHLDQAHSREKDLAREADGLRNQVRSQKAAKTRLVNRVKKGVCPCCKRYFANLHRHMETQHPEHKTEQQPAK